MHNHYISFTVLKYEFTTYQYQYFSSYLKKLLEPFQNEEENVIFLPDYLSEDFLKIVDIICVNEIDVCFDPIDSDLLQILGIKTIQKETNNDLSDSFQSETILSLPENTSTSHCHIPEYMKSIPEVPTDIETAELFDPDYLEAVMEMG